ncbi:hypothetical protein BN2537_14841 [Streptomyces venezuelae]|nr:hypothetical protein BN2537_14841 [Streptomyces venezuelae]
MGRVPDGHGRPPCAAWWAGPGAGNRRQDLERTRGNESALSGV